MNKLKSLIMKSICSVAALHIFSLLTLTWIQGSSKQTISGTFWILSSLINFGSLGATGMGIGTWYLLKSIFKSAPLTLGIPTIFSACSYGITRLNKKTLALAIANAALHVGLPLSCMVLFINQNGLNMSILYTAYWLIPVALWVLSQFNRARTELSFALSSTFIAHALGSIITMLFIPMSPAQWVALIPIVAVERLVLATGQVVTLQLVQAVVKTVRNITTCTLQKQAH